MDKNEKYDAYCDKVFKLLDQLFAKPDISAAELKNANEALCFLDNINKVRRGDAMRDEFDGAQYGSNSWIASGPYPDDGYGNNYGRRMRSSTTGRYMNGPNPGQMTGTYGHSIEDRMVASLEDMMDQAHNEYERQQIQKQIQDIRKGSMM